MPAPSPRPDAGRRAFLQRLAAAGVAGVLPPGAIAFAQGAPVAPAAPAPPAAPASETPSPEAQALAQVLRARYGDRLDTAQWSSVTSDFDGDLAAGKRLHAVRLANGDGPDTVFRA